MKINNLLAVVAHPDDLEMMAAGSMLKFNNENIKTHVLVLTNGSWVSQNGEIIRSKEESMEEMNNVSTLMKYTTCNILDEKTLELQFKDSLVCEVLNRIDKFNIDTLLTTWNKDSHRDHRVASEIALAASRRVPNYLMGQVNYYMTDFFTPNFFIDITSEWDSKIKCLSLFESQWQRNEKDWTEFLDNTSRYYGKVIGVERAEGFIAKRMKY